MTSLARQLEKLALPSSQLSSLKRETRRVSLLFSAIEAAKLDRDTVFGIGLSGLEYLENVDDQFFQFESTLFSDSSKVMERSVQSKETNVKLDEDISSFLLRVSPYFPLKASHKTLEWLIYRFHIELFNIDDFIMAILPYHDTNMFVKVIQILKLNDKSSRWNWIQPIQKPGVPLSKNAVVNHCKADQGFMLAICEQVLKTIKIHKSKILQSSNHPMNNLLAFYSSTIIGAIQTSQPVTERLVSLLTPYLLKGLKSRVTDYKAASLMIVGSLVTRTTLSNEFIVQLINNIAKHFTSELATEAVMTLAIIIQNQKLKEINDHSFEYITSMPNMMSILEELYTDYDVSALLKVLIPKLVEHVYCQSSVVGPTDDRVYDNLLHALMRDIQLDVSTQLTLGESILNQYIIYKTDNVMTEETGSMDCIANYIQMFEKRYPETMEKVITGYIQQEKPDSSDFIIEDFVRMSQCGFKHKHLSTIDTSLVLALSHADKYVRLLAINSLQSMLDTDTNFKVDTEFVKNALIQRLEDDDREIVTAVLNMKHVLETYIDRSELLTVLMKLLQTYKHDGELLLSVFSMIINTDHVSISTELSLQTIVTVLPVVLQTSDTECASDILASVCTSLLIKSNPLFKHIDTVIHKYKKKCNDGMRLALLDQFSANLLSIDSAYSDSIIQTLIEQCKSNNSNTSLLITAMLLVGRLIYNQQHSPQLLHHIRSAMLLVDSDVIPDDVKTKKSLIYYTISEVVAIDDKSAWKPLAVKYWLLIKIIHSLAPSHILAEAGLWWSPCISTSSPLHQQYINIMLHIFHYCSYQTSIDIPGKQITAYKHCLELLFKTHLTTSGTLFSFLSMIMIQHTITHRHVSDPIAHSPAISLIYTQITQLSGLVVARFMMESVQDWVGNTLNTDEGRTIIPGLLIALGSQSESVREAAMLCFNTIKQITDKHSCCYNNLVNTIIKSSEELVTDNSGISAIVASAARKHHSTRKSLAKNKTNFIDELINLILISPTHVSLALLRCVADVDNTVLLTGLLPLVNNMLTSSLKCDQPTLTTDQYQLITLLITLCYNDNTIHQLENSLSCLQTFLDILSLSTPVPITDTQTTISTIAPQSILLKQITKEFYSSLSQSVQHQILTKLFDQLSTTDIPDVAADINKTIKRIIVDGHLLANELKHETDITMTSPKTRRDVKRIRRSIQSSTEEPVLDSLPWKRTILILEFLQTKKKITNIDKLIQPLFRILKKCVEAQSNQRIQFEYIKQLILTCLINITAKLYPSSTTVSDITNTDISVYNIKLIVQCIQDISQTHQQALLLLVHIANINPDLVLDHVMSIFTFMGASVIRQDDEYSLQVITKTLTSIIPALIKANESKNIDALDSSAVICQTMRTFVDSLPHIPEHRKLVLFTELGSTVGCRQYLWMLLGLLFEFHVNKSADNYEDYHTDHVSKPSTTTTAASEKAKTATDYLEFCVSLCVHFEPVVVIEALNKIVEYITTLPHTKPNTGRSSVRRSTHSDHQKQCVVFNVATHTDKQLRHYKFIVLTFISRILSHNKFVELLVDCENDIDIQSELQVCYQSLLETMLAYIPTLATLSDTLNKTSSVKYWKTLLHKAYDILDKVNGLLPPSTFITVVSGLLTNSNATIRRKSMDLLNNKLLHSKHRFTQQQLLLGLVEQLVSVVDCNSDKYNTEPDINKQTALYSVKLLCRNLAMNYPEHFTKIMPTIYKIFSSEMYDTVNPQVCAGALLCSAELVARLSAHAIQFLPTIMSHLFRVFDRSDLSNNELLMLSAVTVVHKTVQTLPNFISQYLQDLIVKVCCVYVPGDSAENREGSTKHQLVVKLNSLKHCIATNLPPRVLLPAIQLSYVQIGDNPTGICAVMFIICQHIENMGKSEMRSYNSQLTSLLLLALDYRQQHNQITDVGSADVDSVEGNVINAVLQLVMKSTETMFRPMYHKLFNWATTDSDMHHRLITFFSLTKQISNNLKNLFVLFAGRLFKLCTGLLDTNHIVKNPSGLLFGDSQLGIRLASQLVQLVTDVLYNIFLYDNVGAVDQERFSTLMQPLVDQIENMIGGEEAYQDRITNHLTPCIGQLAAVLSDDAMRKPLNYQILLKTRNDSAKVRFAALNVLNEFHKKLGEDYMNLIPETIPFLAELMEDESTDVEEYVHTVISAMEETVGEPLQKYF